MSGPNDFIEIKKIKLKLFFLSNSEREFFNYIFLYKYLKGYIIIPTK